MERETGIEPALVAWKATVLPLNYSRAGSNPGWNVPPLKRRLLVRQPGGAFYFDRVPMDWKVVEGGGFEPPKA
jgi:hypothetical protein